MSSIEVLRKSVLKWIKCEVEKITSGNIKDILVYIADQWYTLNSSSSLGLNSDEKETLKKISVMTECGTLAPANKCYWPNSDRSFSAIPGIQSIISSEEFVSSEYNCGKIKTLLEELGVHHVNNLKFTDIYEKYSDNLNRSENMKWFFYHLIKYWEEKKQPCSKDKLLTYLRKKFQSSNCLRSRRGKMCYSTELYSSRFSVMHDVHPNSVPLLDYNDALPVDLEEWLGIKKDLEMSCIVQLLEAFKPVLGPDKTRDFFTTILEQLKKKHRHQVKSYQLSLLSKNNELKPAKSLYYFIEEDATCYLESIYLRRIDGMSHKDTLDLAKLCGVNVRPYRQDVSFGPDENIYDDTLKVFYIKRLPFIALQEYKEWSVSASTFLKRLYSKISSIELYKCSKISIQYPFGSPVETSHHFNSLKIYTVGDWDGRHKTKIHNHLCKKLELKTDVSEIRDLKLDSGDINWWLYYKKINREELNSLEKELEDLISEADNSLNPHQREELDLHDSLIDEYFETEVPKNEQIIPDESLTDQPSSLHFEVRNRQNPLDSKSEERTDIPESVEDRRFKRNGGSFSEGHFKNKYIYLLDENGEGKKFLKWLGEDYVFTFIQNNERTHPHLKLGLQKGIRWLSSPVVEISVDECELKGHIEGAINVIINWLVQEQGGDDNNEDTNIRNPKQQQSEIPSRNYSTESPNSLSFTYPLDGYNETLFLNWLSEKYVLNFLPIHVRNKERLYWRPSPQVEFLHSKDNENIVILHLNVNWFIPCERSSKSVSDERESSIPVNRHSTEPNIASPVGCLNATDGVKRHAKWIGEKNVFNFLQNHYKNKYPNSEYNLSGGTFTLKWQGLHKIEVIWLNESGDKGKGYDLLLKKDEAIKQVIEVESTYASRDDSCKLSYEEFMKRIKCVNKQLSRMEGKYCLYRVFNVQTPGTTTCVVDLSTPVTLYKIVQLKSI